MRLEFDAHKGYLTELKSTVARLQGKADALREREIHLKKIVGLAKGRLASKKEVQSFIDQMQEEAHRKSTQTFETLLSSIVKEVLPHEKEVSLELTTERGLPALNLSMVAENGIKEDILLDHGGALNNVITMGLRMIAVVKSGGAKFLALDEPECWVRLDRVPYFFNVVKDASNRLKIQTIIITHHSVKSMDSPDTYTLELTGTPEAGVHFEANQPKYEWNDEEDGFRYIRLHNFQTYKDCTIPLVPGVNALIGMNSLGKSSVMRALRAVFYGELRDSLIRHGEKETIIEIGLKHGRKLRLSRALKRNPKNIWSLHEKDGSVVNHNGDLRETASTSTPEWVDNLLGIHRTEDLDIHLALQMEPSFLLDQKPAKRAAVLSIGQESGYTNDMLLLHKEKCTQDSAIVRDGEKEIGEIITKLEELEGINTISEQIDEALEILSIANEWDDYMEALQEIMDNFEKASQNLNREQEKLSILENLKEINPEKVYQKIDRSIELTMTLSNFDDKKIKLGKEKSKLNTLKELPSPPDMQPLINREEAIKAYENSKWALEAEGQKLELLSQLPSVPNLNNDNNSLLKQYEDAREKLALKMEEISVVESRIFQTKMTIDSLLAENGGLCPTCGQKANVDDVLRDHR